MSPPRITTALARPRLFRLLDQRAARPVIWVQGPAGSGKTTLAASWLARRAGRSLWYQLDARDRDPATFFHYLREAVRRVAPRRRELAPLTPEHLADVDAYARNFFEGLFERLGTPAVLVLDDFQELSDDAPLHGILAAVLGAIPEGANVLVLSRAAPPPALARLRANSVMATLGWEALRFTSKEAAGLLVAHGLPSGDPAALAELREEADGWAAGLVLLGEAARRGERPEAAGQRRPPAELFEYFATQLFDRASPAVQRVLLATAPLATFCAAIADRLAGQGAGAILDRLARDHLFTTRRGGEAVFQYHPLFRAFLLARAETALAPGERVALQRQAAGMLDEAGLPEEALAILQGIGDAEGAGALVVRLAPSLAAQGRLRTLEAWIRALPDGVREADPWLLHWLAASRDYADPRESLALHERAFAAFQARGDDAACLAAWIAAMTAIMIGDALGGDWDGAAFAAPWLRWLEARMRRAPELPSPAVTANVAGMLVTRLLMTEPSHPDLPAWAARLAAIVESLGNPDARVRALHPLVWYRAWTGDLAALAADADALERACRASGVPTSSRIVGLGVVAIAASYATCDRERTLACTAEALRLAEAEGIHAYDIWLHRIAAQAHHGRGEPAGAAPHLDAIRRGLGAGAETDPRYLHAAAGQALCLGDLDTALSKVESAARGLDRNLALVRPPVEFDLGQLLRARGDLAGAERHLAIVEGLARASHAAPFLWACRLMRAQLALGRGARDAGRRLLAEALAEGRSRGFANVPHSSSALAFAGLCEEALEAGIEVDYVRRLIRLHDLAPDPAHPGAERWPFAVRVTALGPFAVHDVDGRALARSSTRSRPVELLKILVALGGREVAAPRLVELLWPEAADGIGRQRLRFTLHGLRRRLGQDAVRFEGGFMALDARRVWVDSWALDRQLARLAAAVERGNEDDARDALVRAVGFHRGPLLEDEEAPWAVAARERLDARLRRLVLRAVELEGVATAAALPALERARVQLPRDAELQQALARARARAGAPSSAPSIPSPVVTASFRTARCPSQS